MNKIIIRILMLSVMTAACATSMAQDKRQFSPKQFKASFEEYAMTNAGISPEESEALFKVYWEMKDKQRAIFSSIGEISRTNLDELGEKDTKALLDRQLKLSQQLSKIEAECVEKMRKITTNKKIIRLLDVEKKFQRDFLKRHHGPHRHGNPSHDNHRK